MDTRSAQPLAASESIENGVESLKPESPLFDGVGSLKLEPPSLDGVGSLKLEPPSCNGEVNFKITKEMIKIEEQLESKFLVEEQNLHANETTEESEEMRKKQCFIRLQHLLGRSNIYAQFLIDRLDKQKALALKKVEGSVRHRQKLKELQQSNVGNLKTHRGRKCGINEDMRDVECPKQPIKRQRNKCTQLDSEKNDTEIERSSKKKKYSKIREKEVQIGDIFNKEDLQALSVKENEPEVFIDTFSRTLNGEKVSDRQPSLVSGGTMRSYQLDALDWLKVLYENGVNGILADEMGLGKTIECIALIAHLVEKGVCGPFFIICPLSTLSNWVREFKRFTPLIPVISYHGTKDERKELRKGLRLKVPVLNELMHPIIITSYNIAMIDRVYFCKYRWMIIVDEAHRIKNFECLLIRELKKYPSSNRLLLTGTPLQNNLAELWSLLNFLLPEVFDDLKVFESWFDISALSQGDGDEKIIAQERENQIISTIHQILTPFLLRRTKADVALDLPPKKEVIVYAPLSVKQKELYAATVDNTIRILLGKSAKCDSPNIITEKRKRRMVNYCELNDDDSEIEAVAFEEISPKNLELKKESCVVNIKMTNVMMMLRKICNHPYLVEYPLDPATDDYLINEDLIKSCGKLFVLDSMLRELKKRGHKVLIFSQMTSLLHILEHYCELRGYACNYLDGHIRLDDRQRAIDDFNTNPSTFLFLLSSKAGGLGINLTGADTVIIYDSDWNPQGDLQAQDRCHRLGQTKPVVVYRLVTSKTIDEKIVERACAKRKLEKMIIQKGRFSNKDQLWSNSMVSQKELLELLKSKDYSDCVNIEDVISPERLNMLLDRSDMYISNESSDQRVFNKSSVPSEVEGLFKVMHTTNSYI